MHDDIFGINQHPVRRWQTFDAGMTSGLFDTLGKLLRHRGHLARRTARCDNHMVGNIAFAFKRDGDHFLRLIIIKRLKNQRMQRVGGQCRFLGLCGGFARGRNGCRFDQDGSLKHNISGNAVTRSKFLISVKPIWVRTPKSGGRTGIWTKAQKDKRWRTPFRPVMTLVRTPDKPPEPGHCGTRNDLGVIAGSGDNCNRHQSRYIAPPPPVMKLQQIVGAHNPNELRFWVTRHQFLQRFGGVDGAKRLFDSGDFNRCALCLCLCRCHPRGQRRHVRLGF